ncbi:MAG: tetratricopeptide repeat protein [Chitinophagales bacterium]|nr:tetratricopeptide repeat protein [Chitinophagales bacterium]
MLNTVSSCNKPNNYKNNATENQAVQKSYYQIIDSLYYTIKDDLDTNNIYKTIDTTKLNSSNKVYTIILSSIQLINSNNIYESEDLLLSTINTLENNNINPIVQEKYYNTLSRVYFIQSNSKALKYALKGLEIAKTNKLSPNYSYYMLGNAYLNYSDYNNAIKYYYLATQKNTDNLFLANLYNNIAITYQRFNQLDSTEKYYKLSLENYYQYNNTTIQQKQIMQ